MNIKADEISKIIREQIGSYAVDVDVAEVGSIVSIGDGIARVHGVENAMAGEMLEFPHGVFGIALNLEEESVGAVLLGEFRKIKEGDLVKRTGRIISVPVGEELLGRVVNALGQPIDGKGPIATKQFSPIERLAPGVVDRQPRARAAADRPQGHRRDGADRPRPARADHRRPADGQDRRRHRRDPQPEGHRRHLHLQRDRPEAVDGGPGREDARRSRRDALHHRRRGDGVRPRAAALHQPVLGVHDRRVLPRQRPPRAGHLRRLVEARAGVSRNLAAAPPAAGPRGVSGRRVLPALAAARARGEAEQGAGRRFADGAADHRDAGRRPVGVHPDQRDFDHRRPDLPRSRTCSTRACVPPSTSATRCRASAARRRSRPCGRSRARCASTWRSTASSRRSRSSAATSTRRRRRS